MIGVTLQLYDHGAATGRKGACCAGQDIHDARRVADHLGIPHYVIDAEARFRARGDRRFRRQLCRRRDAGAVRALQPDGEVRRPAGAGRAISAPSGWRPAITCGASTAPDGPELHRAADAARDQSWFLFATTRGAARRSACSRSATCPTRAACAPQAARLGLPVAAKPDSQDICFVPAGSYADVVGAAAPGRAGAGRDRRPRPATWSAGMTASPATRWARRKRLGARRRRRAASGAWWWRWTRRGGAWWSAPRGAGSRHVRLREVNWLRRAAPARAAR